MIEQLEINLLCRMILDEKGNYLIYGQPSKTTEILREIYEKAKTREEFLCTWHDASRINTPMDFFEPILKLKYGEDYACLKQTEWFKELAEKNEPEETSRLAEICGREKDSEWPMKRKTPIFFIDGMEELLFKMDYGHLNSEEVTRVLTGSSIEAHRPKCFGDRLRGYLHHKKTGIFCGTVKNTESVEYKATLGNYGYLFYSENFGHYEIR